MRFSGVRDSRGRPSYPLRALAHQCQRLAQGGSSTDGILSRVMSRDHMEPTWPFPASVVVIAPSTHAFFSRVSFRTRKLPKSDTYSSVLPLEKRAATPTGNKNWASVPRPSA
eukprot:1193939-Prorocentrum_minimum.AAC.2